MTLTWMRSLLVALAMFAVAAGGVVTAAAHTGTAHRGATISLADDPDAGGQILLAFGDPDDGGQLHAQLA